MFKLQFRLAVTGDEKMTLIFLFDLISMFLDTE